MKLQLNEKLVSAILPLALVIVEGAGKLWDASRDAFVIALGEYHEPADAAKAVRQVIEDNAKGNPGSVRAYLSTLVWLASKKDGKGNKAGNLKADAIAKLTMGQATDLRYPKQPKLAADDYEGKIARLTEKKKAADKRKAEEAKAEAEANAKDPRRALLSVIATKLAGLDLTKLEIVAGEVVRIVDTLDASDDAASEDAEANEGGRTGTDG